MSEINDSAEFTTRRIVDWLYYVTMFICIVGFLWGLSVGLLNDGGAGNVFLILTTLLTMVALTLWRSLIHIFANISCKLDANREILKKMEAIELLLKEKQNPVESGETVAPTSEIVDNDNPELK